MASFQAYDLALGTFSFLVYNLTDFIAPRACGFRYFYSGILKGRCSMFESLSERIKEDERGTVSNTQRTLFWVGIFVVVAAGLFFGVKLFN
jgi:hypothetical protein